MSAFRGRAPPGFMSLLWGGSFLCYRTLATELPLLTMVLSRVLIGAAAIIFFGLMASAGPTNLSLVTLLIPPSALLMGWAILGEPITANAIMGMAVIAAGLIVIDGRVFRPRSR